MPTIGESYVETDEDGTEKWRNAEVHLGDALYFVDWDIVYGKDCQQRMVNVAIRDESGQPVTTAQRKLWHSIIRGIVGE